MHSLEGFTGNGATDFYSRLANLALGDDGIAPPIHSGNPQK